MVDITAHSTEPLTIEETEYVRACIERAQFRPEIKQCFVNSQRVLLFGDFDERLVYAEGLMATFAGGDPELPLGLFHHGWLLLEGKVVDVTLGCATLGIKVLTPKGYRVAAAARSSVTQADEYYGTTFDRASVAQVVFQGGCWGPMLDESELLRTGTGPKLPEGL